MYIQSFIIAGQMLLEVMSSRRFFVVRLSFRPLAFSLSVIFYAIKSILLLEFFVSCKTPLLYSIDFEPLLSITNR